MRLFVALAILGGIRRDRLEDPDALRSVVLAAVEAGGFSLHDLVMTRFHPSGVTGTAVLGESHLSIHTWPDDGRMFVDVASCTTRDSVERALRSVVVQLQAEVVTSKLEELIAVGTTAQSIAASTPPHPSRL